MTLRPGTSITSISTPPPRGQSGDTSTWFVVGAAPQGPTTFAQLVQSMSDFTLYFGNRQSYSILYDAMQTFFEEGGTRAYVARVAGPSSVIAAKTLLDASAGNSLTVQAKNPGTWGNNLTVQVTQPVSNTYQLLIFNSSVLVDQSPYLTDQASAINWSKNSQWVNVILPVSTPSVLIPAVAAAAALTSGADDVAGITDAQRQGALALFTSDLGPGQVSIPGNVTTGNRTALVAHATAYNREAILDDTDSPSRSAIVTEALALQGSEYGSIFAPWVIIPGIAPNTTVRTVPPCALVAGLLARNDSSGSPNRAAAATNGISRYALDVSQPAWSDVDRDALNTAGVNVIRNFAGNVQLYGNRTLVNPNVDTTWIELSNQRLRLRITDDANDIAEQFVFAELDGRGLTIASFQGALIGMLTRYWQDGSLYGNTAAEAFQVNVGSNVNTTTTLNNGELHAVIGVRMSPSAELVAINIAKVSISQSLV